MSVVVSYTFRTLDELRESSINQLLNKSMHPMIPIFYRVESNRKAVSSGRTSYIGIVEIVKVEEEEATTTQLRAESSVCQSQILPSRVFHLVMMRAAPEGIFQTRTPTFSTWPS